MFRIVFGIDAGVVIRGPVDIIIDKPDRTVGHRAVDTAGVIALSGIDSPTNTNVFLVVRRIKVGARGGVRGKNCIETRFRTVSEVENQAAAALTGIGKLGPVISTAGTGETPGRIGIVGI